MEFARGVKEVLLYEAGFDNPVDAAEFWSDAGVYVEYEDMTYPGGEGQDQRLRLYRGGEADRPTLLYIHGGGWVGGSIELHDYSARGMAFEARCNVVSISYRLAPVYRFPSGLDDCMAATTWIEQMGASLGINPECIVIGGASAGGNLAAAAALASDQFRYSGLLVFYGVLGCDFETDSYLRYSHGPGLTKARMKELFSLYLGDMHQAQDPLVSPLLSAELEKLPRTYVIAAEHDVLLEENRSFVAALKAASVPVGLHIEPGVTHGFINRGRLVPSADTSISIAANFLASFAQTENQ